MGVESVNLEQLPAAYYRSKNFIGSLIAVGLMAISLYLGYVLPVNSLTAIDAELGPDKSSSLISTVFTLISGVAVLLVGRFGDVFGRRYFLIGGQLLSLVGALVCATAQKIPTIIGGSVLCGLAAAVQLTFTFVISELVPNKARPMVSSGLFLATFPFAAFGGLIAQMFIANTQASWRWSYYLNIITSGLSVILLVLFYFPPGWDAKHKGESRLDALKKFDYIGLVLYAGGLILLLLGLAWGGTSYAWSSAHVVSVLVIGLVCLIALVLYEIFAPLEQPLLPMSLLRNRGYSATVGSGIVGNMVYFSMSLLWPKAVGALFTKDPIQIGWHAVSVGCGCVMGEIACGLLMKPLGHSKYQLIGCTAAVMAFSGALAAMDQDREAYGLAFTAIGAFAVGYLELITIIMCPLFCKSEDIGLASGFLGSAKSVGGTIATAIYVAILNNRLSITIPANVSAAATKAGLPQSSLTDLLKAVSSSSDTAMNAVPGINPHVTSAVMDAVRTANSQSFRTVFLVTVAFGGMSLVAALFSVDVDERLNNEVAAKLCGTEASTEKLCYEEDNMDFAGEKQGQ
ncbi:siderophore iron transporter [Aspergillus coremiiformis]|uniref:Siderophore iron transporter n=1 Tax=Aspergillus coremiiformis TaxID=138285 RepID=A0A5N6Z759_9EURO|nr:siderophore iron transporter [Aspergillus coremiiformis]